MFRYFKRMFTGQIARLASGVLYAKKIADIQKISTLPNADINDNVSMGNGTSFLIQGSFNRIYLGKDVFFRSYCNILIYPRATLVIEEKVFFNNYCSINCLGKIEIGEKTLFGEGVKIYDHNHQYEFEKGGRLVVQNDDYSIGHVKIGKNCWIGSNVTILPNVEIGDNVIIGAHCLIYKSIPSNSIVKHTENLIITQNK